MHRLRELDRRGSGHDIQLAAELLAVVVEREIVYVVAEGVLELVSDGGQANNNVGSSNSAGDSDPAERTEELEGEEVDVEENDLGDKNVVADGKGSGEDTLGRGHGVCQGREGCNYTHMLDGGLD